MDTRKEELDKILAEEDEAMPASGGGDGNADDDSEIPVLQAPLSSFESELLPNPDGSTVVTAAMADASSSINAAEEYKRRQEASAKAAAAAATEAEAELTEATATVAKAAARVIPGMTSRPEFHSPEYVTLPEGEYPNGMTREAWFTQRAQYIPLRLTYAERRSLRLLEAALNVSEYTDKVDIYAMSHRATRIHKQLRDICAILSGMLVASDYRLGQKLLADKDFKENAEFFQTMFEIGRRYKIMNPSKMRTDYGKLVYLLQDSNAPRIKELLEFQCVQPIKTVHSSLKAADALGLLADELLPVATMEVLSNNRPRHLIQRDIKHKNHAVEILARKYANAKISQDDIRHCLYSIADNSSFLNANSLPVEKMLHFLHRYFNPSEAEEGFSLSIQSGRGGSRLSHDHRRQFHFVEQSMLLWREILNDFYKLWFLAEDDLLSERNQYRLCNTGQGLNRVQSAPNVGNEMNCILRQVQRRVGSWIGSSAIHLGDHNVPNALMFIDKYTQVSRILNPVVLVIEAIDKLMEKPAVARFIEGSFGTADNCKKTILADFFRHGFNGSGADNFFDAGSCIDGRLTSAWNWCSTIEKKPYYHVFLLAGFVGFDGDFNK